jgi:hypothetical protein
MADGSGIGGFDQRPLSPGSDVSSELPAYLRLFFLPIRVS